MYISTQYKKVRKYKLGIHCMVFDKNEFKRGIVDFNSIKFYKCIEKTDYKMMKNNVFIIDELIVSSVQDDNAISFSPYDIGNFHTNKGHRMLAIYDCYEEVKAFECDFNDKIKIQGAIEDVY